MPDDVGETSKDQALPSSAVAQVLNSARKGSEMSKNSTSKSTLTVAAATAAVLAACATVDAVSTWNIVPAGSTWQVDQRNTGSYGKDVMYTVTRGDAVWQGQPAVTLANSGNGMTVMATQDGKWATILGRDGKPFVSFDPPIGYVYPLAAGRTWSTHHKMTTPGGVTEFDYTCKVEGREQVTVRAGSFDTMKIVCDSPTEHNVHWFIGDMGMHAKQELQRLAGHPQGAGTQRNELVTVTRKS